MNSRSSKKPLSRDEILDLLVRWYLELYDSTLTGWELEDELTERLIRRGVSARRARTEARRFLDS